MSPNQRYWSNISRLIPITKSSWNQYRKISLAIRSNLQMIQLKFGCQKPKARRVPFKGSTRSWKESLLVKDREVNLLPSAETSASSTGNFLNLQASSVHMQKNGIHIVLLTYQNYLRFSSQNSLIGVQYA